MSFIENSYSTGTVEGDVGVGGLVGQNSGTVTDSYATGSVAGDEQVGGLVGDDRDTVTDSYWDTETSGQSTSDGDGTGLTTSEMQGSEAESNMGGFDFTNTWSSVLESDDDTTADGYPILDSLDRENQLEAQGIFGEVETGGPELATATPVSSSSYPVSSTATTASQSEASPVAAVGTSSSGSPITASTTETFTTTAMASPVKSGGIGTATSTATTASGFATPIPGIGSYEFVTVASASTVSGSLSPATSVGIGVTEAGSSVSTAFSTAQTAGSVTESAVSGGITPISADVAVVSPESASMASGSPISTETTPITVNGLAGAVSGAISTPVAGFSSVSGAETASMSLAGVTEATGTPRFASVVGESEVRAQAFRAIGVGLPETAQGMGVSEVEASVSSAFSESLTPDLALGLRSKASVVPAFSTIQSAGAESVAVAGSSAVSAVSMPVNGIVETSSVSSAIPVYASVVGETATATAWAVSTGSETFVVATPLLGSEVSGQDVAAELSEALASPLVARMPITVRRSRPEGSENRAAFGSSENRAAFGSSENRAAFGSSENRSALGSSENLAAFGSSRNFADVKERY